MVWFTQAISLHSHSWFGLLLMIGYLHYYKWDKGVWSKDVSTMENEDKYHLFFACPYNLMSGQTYQKGYLAQLSRQNGRTPWEASCKLAEVLLNKSCFVCFFRQLFTHYGGENLKEACNSLSIGWCHHPDQRHDNQEPHILTSLYTTFRAFSCK